jgi:hypothetical protein
MPCTLLSLLAAQRNIKQKDSKATKGLQGQTQGDLSKKKSVEIYKVIVFLLLNFFFLFILGTGAWTQGLHLEPLHQPYFCEGFFEIGSHELFPRGWLRTAILLISAS